MLLMKLEAKEKFAFLQLAHYLARVDEEFGQKEEDIIEEYCAEMGVENSIMFDMESFNLKSILKDFKSERSKKIVVLELMILVHIDDKFDLKEYDLIHNIIDTFNLNEKDIKHFSSWGKAVSALYEQGKNFIE